MKISYKSRTMTEQKEHFHKYTNSLYKGCEFLIFFLNITSFNKVKVFWGKILNKKIALFLVSVHFLNVRVAFLAVV